MGTSRATVPPRLRRYILWRDGGCVIDGCGSRYRLQTHHILSASEGGPTDPDNLTALCWYHHHVAIHGQQMRLDPNTPPQRKRLVPPTTRAPP